MQPHQEQSSQEQPSAGTTASSLYSDAPEQAAQPIVTLSPDDDVSPMRPEARSAPGVDIQPVRWQAAEYIHREKDHLWFALFIVATVALIAAAIFLIKSITFAVLIPVMAAALIVYTRRPPRVLDYTLSRKGLHINDQLYPFSEFKSFTLVHGDDEYSIMLIPTKRFKPAVSIYFPATVGEAIVDMLAVRMPMQEAHLDVVDRIIQKLHL